MYSVTLRPVSKTQANFTRASYTVFTLFYRPLWHQKKYIFLVHDVSRSANISIEALSNGNVCKLGQYDFSKGILYELSQYRKANDVSWDDWILKLTEEAVPKLETLKVTLSRIDKLSEKK